MSNLFDSAYVRTADIDVSIVDQLLLEIHVNETPEREYNLELFDNWWNTMEAAGLRAFVGELNYPAIHFTPYPQAIEIGYLNYGNRKHSRGRLLID